MRQPAPKQQLQTPTSLPQVKTHHALLFRQTQITASSADCSRDEQTHINYRLNFGIHLSRARKHQQNCFDHTDKSLFQPTEPCAGPRHPGRKQHLKLFSTPFSLLLPSPPKKTHTLQQGWRDKITSESSRSSQNPTLHLCLQAPATSGQPQKWIPSLQH